MKDMITVSNGRYCKKIDVAELGKAREDGFDRPFERGYTIVGNGRWIFEVPIAEVEGSASSELLELVESERREWLQGTAASDHVPSEVRDDGSGTQSLPNAAPLAVTGGTKGNASIPIRDGLLMQLNQVELEAQQERKELEQQVAETKGWRYYLAATQLWWKDHQSSLVRQLRSSGISAAVHISILLILASLFLEVEKEPETVFLASATSTMPEVEEVIFESTPLEISEPEESQETEESAPVEETQPQAFEAPDFVGAVRGDAIAPPAKPAAASGKGESMALKESTFFGNRVTAVNYVFVIDNSNSMTNGRFETALNELMITVSQLTPRQRFYVIFYSDVAYPMFHPQPASQLVPATPRNKEMLRRWLATVQLCLKTNGKEAISAAFQLNPDVIFVLGDGAFTDRASTFFASKPQNKIPLHTLGMEVKPKDAITFKQLADAHGGTYKDVGVLPQARVVAKQNPRPRNTTRGPIWGLGLGQKK